VQVPEAVMQVLDDVMEEQLTLTMQGC